MQQGLLGPTATLPSVTPALLAGANAGRAPAAPAAAHSPHVPAARPARALHPLTLSTCLPSPRCSGAGGVPRLLGAHHPGDAAAAVLSPRRWQLLGTGAHQHRLCVGQASGGAHPHPHLHCGFGRRLRSPRPASAAGERQLPNALRLCGGRALCCRQRDCGRGSRGRRERPRHQGGWSGDGHGRRHRRCWRHARRGERLRAGLPGCWVTCRCLCCCCCCCCCCRRSCCSPALLLLLLLILSCCGLRPSSPGAGRPLRLPLLGQGRVGLRQRRPALPQLVPQKECGHLRCTAVGMA